MVSYDISQLTQKEKVYYYINSYRNSYEKKYFHNRLPIIPEISWLHASAFQARECYEQRNTCGKKWLQCKMVQPSPQKMLSETSNKIIFTANQTGEGLKYMHLRSGRIKNVCQIRPTKGKNQPAVNLIRPITTYGAKK